ncbi:MAG: hypothetical protein QM758_01080 [Armatimonas sp.]
MDLFPYDLRARHHTQTVYARAMAGYGQPGVSTPAEPPPPKLGFLGRIWAKGSGLTEAQAARVNPAASTHTQASTWLTGGLGSFFSGMVFLILCKKSGLDPAIGWASWTAATAGLFALGAGPFAQAAFKDLNRKPLSVSEIDALVEKSEDDLERTFLGLVRDAIRTNLPDPPASEVRKSISALAEALDSLPEVAPSAVDTDNLRAEADSIDAQALAETDRVTSDSFTRRADALRRRAESAERTALAGKRTAALKAEIQAQIEALREGLAALSVDTARSSLADLSHMAENVRRVAAEAVSSIDAENEVDRISPRPVVVESETPQQQVLRR